MGRGRAVGIVDAYTGGSISLQEAVRQIAEPIEWAYTTADGGRLFVSEEKSARYQPRFQTPEKALEMWGPEENIEEFQAGVTGSDDSPSLEGELWDLDFSSSMLLRRSHAQVGKQRRPTKSRQPPSRDQGTPEPTTAAEHDRSFEASLGFLYGELLSDLAMLGIANTECWNDFPGCGWVGSTRSQRLGAGECICGALAHAGDPQCRCICSWALRDALETGIEAEDNQHCRLPTNVDKAESLFRVAAVWIYLAGQYMYSRLVPDLEEREDLEERSWSLSQWDRWQNRFEEEAEKAQYSDYVTGIARECAARMAAIAASASARAKCMKHHTHPAAFWNTRTTYCDEINAQMYY